MTSFCLHKVKKVYKVDYASKDKSNKKKFQIACLSEHQINSRDISHLICVAKLQSSLHA